LHRRFTYQQKPPFYTVDANNVRPQEPLEERIRGGSRPGLAKSFSKLLGTIAGTVNGTPVKDNGTSTITGAAGTLFQPDHVGQTFTFGTSPYNAYTIASFISLTQITVTGDASGEYANDTFTITGKPEVRMLAPLRTAPARQTAAYYSDQFDGEALGSEWTKAGVWGTLPTVSGGYAVGSTESGEQVGAVLDARTSMDKARTWVVRARVEVRYGNIYGLYAGMDDSSPDVNACVYGTISFGTTTPRTLYLSIKVNAELKVSRTWNRPENEGTWGWLVLERTSDGYVGLTFTGNTGIERHVRWFHPEDFILVGTRASIRLHNSGNPSAPRMARFLYEHLTAAVSSYAPYIIMASANGLLYKTDTTGAMVQVTNGSPPTLASDRMIHAAQRLGKLYIADYGNKRENTDLNDSAVTAGVLDDDDVSDWTDYGIEILGDLVEIANSDVPNPTTGVPEGVYKIETIHATDGLTLVGLGAGNTNTKCTYRVLRAPKIYDPVTDTLAIWWATSGMIPPACTIVEVYRDRLVLAGDPDNPGLWYMSAQSNPLDFDYGATATGAQAATAGTAVNSDVGNLPRPITAIAAVADDYCIFAALGELWVLRGDPMIGGQMDNVSRTVGIISPGAWCRTPDGTLIILSRNGLYRLIAGAVNIPEAVSEDRIPQELVNIDTDQNQVRLEYEVRGRGIHVFVSPPAGPGGSHYWFSWFSQGFCPASFAAEHEPFSACYSLEDNAVLCGCRDGYVRQFASTQETDDGTTIESHVMYGPIRLGANNIARGIWQELIAVLDANSGDVDWEILVGDSAQAAYTARVFASGTWSAGLNRIARPKAGGHSAYLRLKNNGASAWAVERLTGVIESVGRLLQR
jgi:hypothetical protein